MKPMTYRGYAVRTEYSDEDECLVGHIAGIRDILGFQGDNVADLRAVVHEAVDDYLAASERLGRDPQKSYSGILTLRVASELHVNVAMQAQAAGKSINQWAAQTLDRAAQAGM